MCHNALHPRHNRIDLFVYHAPTALIEYPLECLLSAWGLLSGIPLLLGGPAPYSLTSLLPSWVSLLWSIMLTLSGATIAYGLVRKRYASTTARGLLMLAPATLAYAVAIFTANVAGGHVAALLLVFIALLCMLRGVWLRARAVVQLRIAAEMMRLDREEPLP